MRRVRQTRFGDPHGNCMEACIASIFEMPIERIPTLYSPKGDGWYRTMEIWSASQGFMPITVRYPDKGEPGRYPSGALCIVGGQSPRGDFDHAVVWQCGRHAGRGRMIWDPHPSDAGIVGEPKDYTFFVKMFRAAAVERTTSAESTSADTKGGK